MRNNFVEYVNGIMGNRFVEHQRISAFIGDAFDAKRLHSFCWLRLKHAGIYFAAARKGTNEPVPSRTRPFTGQSFP